MLIKMLVHLLQQIQHLQNRSGMVKRLRMVLQNRSGMVKRLRMVLLTRIIGICYCYFRCFNQMSMSAPKKTQQKTCSQQF